MNIITKEQAKRRGRKPEVFMTVTIIPALSALSLARA
jgi:hypothetical protein